MFQTRRIIINKNLGNKDNNYDDYDKCIFIACKEFEKMHSKEEQPEWLKYCISIKGNRNQYRNWVIKFVLQPKPKLQPNEYWEWEDDGIPILVQVDPITDKKQIVICKSQPLNIEVFFEVEINHINGLATVHVDTDLSMLNGNHYSINRRY